MNDFILALFEKNDKLKTTTLLQILTGKRTSSVMCYAFFHDLLPVYGLFPELNEKEWQKMISKAKKAKVIKEKQPGFLEKATTFDQVPVLLSGRNYLKLGRRENECWRLVQFFVQVVSFYGRQVVYVPLESSPFYTETIRNIFNRHRSNEQLNEQLYQELTYIFSKMNQEDADVLAQTLSGYGIIAKDFFQIIPKKYQDTGFQRLYQSTLIQEFLAIVQQKTDFLLYELVKPQLFNNYNQSMLQTCKLLKQGMAVGQVCAYRQLKMGTISDHIIEWALLDDTFPFEWFISPKLDQQASSYEFIWKASYQHLKEEITTDFLTIRLMQIQQKRVQIC